MATKSNQALRKTIGKALRSVGILKDPPIPADLDAHVMEIARKVARFTMTSPERINGLVNGIEYVVEQGLPGSIVECGVYRGGSMMAATLALMRAGDRTRDVYLFDTYEGMPEPTSHDVDRGGVGASAKFTKTQRDGGSDWCYASLEDVQANLASVQYPADKLHFIKGKVEDTIPAGAPEKIALLRLDTDWYESTRHEMEHLFPRLVPGGVLILDDYGKWQGARKAVDEYLGKHGIRLLLNRLDGYGRMALKPL